MTAAANSPNRAPEARGGAVNLFGLDRAALLRPLLWRRRLLLAPDLLDDRGEKKDYDEDDDSEQVIHRFVSVLVQALASPGQVGSARSPSSLPAMAVRICVSADMFCQRA